MFHHGQQLGSFEILERIGEGAMGAVYKARQTSLHRLVALKTLQPVFAANPDFIARFRREANAAASLNHPNLVQVYSAGETDGLHWFAMEFVEGEAVDARLERKGRLNSAEAIAIAMKVASALDYGWQKARLIHRDIKPSNIFLSSEWAVKLGDLGIAKMLAQEDAPGLTRTGAATGAPDHANPGLTRTGSAMGTPHYVSPEQAKGEKDVDLRSDIYSLGCTLYHMLSGQPPYAGKTALSVMNQHVTAPVPDIRKVCPECPPALAAVIAKAMQKSPAERHQSHAEFEADLEHAQHASRARPPGKSPRPLAWIAGAVALLAAVALLVHFATSKKGMQLSGDESEQTDLSAEARFDAGRKHLVDGRFSQAAKTFRALYDEGSLPEPKNSWAAVQLGLAEYFGGNADQARAAFKALGERIAPSSIGLDTKLVAFLNRLAEIGCDKANVTLAEMEEFDKTSYEALAYIVTAVKKWEAGDFGEAVALFRQFQQATPSGESAWVADYRLLVARHLDDYAVYREIADPIEDKRLAPAETDAARKRIPNAKNKIRSPLLRNKLTALEAESSAKEAIERKKADMIAAEEKTLTDAKLKVKGFVENYRFTEAAAAIQAVNVKLEHSVEERDLLAKRIDWLVQFKRQLIADLNSGGCTLSLQRKNGQQIVGGVVRATDQQLETRVQFGSLPVAWSEISPQSILQMARFYMKPIFAPALLVDRQWQAGVFSLFTELFSEGHILMDEATAQKEEYKNHRRLFFGESAAESPLPLPAIGPLAATRENPFVNTLGMRFVPVSIIGGPTNRQRVLFSVWDTRVKDYAAYAAENPNMNMEWKDAEFRGKRQGATHPVVKVSWEDARGFCQWLTERERKTGRLGANERYRLPIDHEWSCAVGIGVSEDANASPRDKDGRIADMYPWGGAWPPPSGAGNYRWSRDYSFTTSAGSFSANRFGLYDMGGNVSQWCEDSYSVFTDARVMRGASWRNDGRDSLLSSYRTNSVSTARNDSVGFRCVVSFTR